MPPQRWASCLLQGGPSPWSAGPPQRLGALWDGLRGPPSGKPSSEGLDAPLLPPQSGSMCPFSFLPEYKTVDTLLQQMFESEIAPEGKDPSLEEILNFSPKKLNFGNSA